MRNRTGGPGRGKRIAVIAAAVICFLLAAAAAGGYAVFHHYYSLMHRPGQEDTGQPGDSAVTVPADDGPGDDENGDDAGVEPATDDEIDQLERDLKENLEKMEGDSELYDTDAFNVMLIGVDSRKDSFSGRSDSMILFSIDKKEKKVTMTSFLRDIYVSIPGYGSNRLNASYAFGGMDLLTETIKANFGITVDRCVVVNFYVVMDFVDAVDGVDLDLTAAEIKVMNGYIRGQNDLLGNPAETDLMPEQDGTYHVDGNQALAYARVRYVGTDFARTGRQRTVISKCLEKAKTMNLGELTGLAEGFLPHVSTNLTEGDCASLLLMLLGAKDYDIQSMVIPADGTWNYASIRGMSVITVDFDANAKAWHDLVDGEGEE